VTSDFRLEAEVQPFCACTVKICIITFKAKSLKLLHGVEKHDDDISNRKYKYGRFVHEYEQERRR